MCTTPLIRLILCAHFLIALTRDDKIGMFSFSFGPNEQIACKAIDINQHCGRTTVDGFFLEIDEPNDRWRWQPVRESFNLLQLIRIMIINQIDATHRNQMK